MYVSRGSTVFLSYKLFVDGQLIDQAGENDPIQFVQGKGKIISGLERQLNGMRIGETKHLTIEPIHAYGEINPESILTIRKNEIQTHLPIYTGTIIEIKDKTGNRVEGKVIHVDQDEILIDTNHPLAGKTLEFDIKIMDIIPLKQ